MVAAIAMRPIYLPNNEIYLLAYQQLRVERAKGIEPSWRCSKRVFLKRLIFRTLITLKTLLTSLTRYAIVLFMSNKKHQKMKTKRITLVTIKRIIKQCNEEPNKKLRRQMFEHYKQHLIGQFNSDLKTFERVCVRTNNS